MRICFVCQRRGRLSKSSTGVQEGRPTRWVIARAAWQTLRRDTLFAGSIGHTDLWGGSLKDILHSIGEELLVLPDATMVYPGHGPATTTAEERTTNPFLQGH